MRTRKELSRILNSIPGPVKCYYGEPSKGMQYPCILYKLEGESRQYADDAPYRKARRYTLTVIDENPDSEIPDRVAKLPYCTFDRPYYADGLNNFVFTLYF